MLSCRPPSSQSLRVRSQAPRHCSMTAASLTASHPERPGVNGAGPVINASASKAMAGSSMKKRLLSSHLVKLPSQG
jgi:hypothetical protein